ncbi:MAG: ATP-binding protein [Phycisphaerae bacterium]
MPSIQVIEGPDKGRSFDLSEDEGLIGRRNGVVPLSDTTVSRRHAKLMRQNGRWLLEDLGSANGTFLNGTRLVRQMPVHGGDQIRCGTTLLIFGGELSDNIQAQVDLESDQLDAAVVATVPSNEDSVIIPTPEAGRQAIGNLRILYDLIAETGSIFNVDVLLGRIMEKVFGVVQADRGFILLTGEDGKLQLKASRIAGQPADGEKLPISHTIINEVMRNQVGVLSSNAMTDRRFTSGKSVHDLGIRSAMCVPIKGREGILGVIHVDCNVSEHTYSTEQLRLLTAIGYHTGLAVENARLYEQALQSERMAAVGETVSHLSHHIKNILQALGAGTDLVEAAINKGKLDKARDAWPIVQRNLGRINDLILNMLAFSKDREPQREQIDVNDVVNECMELISPYADERGVAVLSNLDDLPAVSADSAGLQQAILNLLSNALDAVADENGVITVSSAYDAREGNVTISVIDNGSGIDPQEMDDIFTAFFSSKGQKGTGLGLAVARKIVLEHDGDIEVESEPGKGTTFTIVLPTGEGDMHDTHHDAEKPE